MSIYGAFEDETQHFFTMPQHALGLTCRKTIQYLGVLIGSNKLEINEQGEWCTI